MNRNDVVARIEEENKIWDVLVIGVGRGDNLKFLTNKYVELYGCDISEFALEETRKLNIPNLNLVRNEYNTLPYKTNFVDVVILSKMISTVSVPNGMIQMISEILRVLSKGGYLLIMDFCYSNTFAGIY